MAPPLTFPDEDPSTAEPTHSSDPAVLGPLGGAEQGSFAEFRAWQPGQATLTSPGGTWLVHVVVLARRLFLGDYEDIGVAGYAGSPGAE